MPLRSLLPWRRFTIDTAWSPADIEREVGFLLDQSQPLDNDLALAGSKWLGGFRIVQGASAQKALVIMSGKVRPTPTGSSVLVTVRPPMRAALLLLIVVPLLTLLSAAVSVAALVRHEGIVLLIWTMPFALWGGVVRPLQEHSHKAEDVLRKLFPPPPPPTAGPFR